MRRLLKLVKWILLGIVALLVVAVGGILGYRAYLQHVNATESCIIQ